MPIHVLRHIQEIPAPVGDCWVFFSDPRNLSRITPPSLDFRVLSELPSSVHAGLMIEYRVRPLLGIPVTWLTEITHVEHGRMFVDEQRVGPYRIWHHQHHFREIESGRTEVRDVIHYVLPWSPFSEIVHPWLVEPQLRTIFEYRERAITEIFTLPQAATDPSSA